MNTKNYMKIKNKRFQFLSISQCEILFLVYLFSKVLWILNFFDEQLSHEKIKKEESQYCHSNRTWPRFLLSWHQHQWWQQLQWEGVGDCCLTTESRDLHSRLWMRPTWKKLFFKNISSKFPTSDVDGRTERKLYKKWTRKPVITALVHFWILYSFLGGTY